MSKEDQREHRKEEEGKRRKGGRSATVAKPVSPPVFLGCAPNSSESPRSLFASSSHTVFV